MAHQVEVTDEHYIFRPETRKKLYYLLIVGIVVFAGGLFAAIRNEGKVHEGGHGEGHHASVATKEMVATSEHVAASEGHAEEGHHAESPTWKRRLFSTLWHNNIFFTGIGLIGLFFVAIQYAAQA